jgi:hypothetical protein
MKTKSIFCAVLMLLALQSCIWKNPSSKILGTWQLMNFQYADQKKTVMPDSIRRIKIINATHFNMVQYMTIPKIVQASAGGSYKYDGENYSEIINWADASVAKYLNKEQKFKVKIVDNKLFLSGQLSSGEKIEEEWIKIE